MHVSLIKLYINKWMVRFGKLKILPSERIYPAHFFITDGCGIYSNIHDVPIKELQDYDGSY